MVEAKSPGGSGQKGIGGVGKAKSEGLAFKAGAVDLQLRAESFNE
jgi:hypothetical protein